MAPCRSSAKFTNLRKKKIAKSAAVDDYELDRIFRSKIRTHRCENYPFFFL